MKIMSNSSLPTSSMSPMVASRSSARYSPRWRGVVAAACEDHREKGERQADDLEERRERRDDQHPVKEGRVFRQDEHCRRGEKNSSRGDAEQMPGPRVARKPEGKNNERGQQR